MTMDVKIFLSKAPVHDSAVLSRSVEKLMNGRLVDFHSTNSDLRMQVFLFYAGGYFFSPGDEFVFFDVSFLAGDLGSGPKPKKAPGK